MSTKKNKRVHPDVEELEQKKEKLKAQQAKSKVQQIPQNNQNDQSSSDDTDDEQILAKIGRVPWKWYENYKHMGYDSNLQKVQKLTQDDKIDEFIKKAENPNWWRIIKDELNQREIVLTDEQLNLIERIRKGKFASKSIAQNDYTVEYEWNDPFPLNYIPPTKKNFMPSKNERIKINKFMQAIQLGRIDLSRYLPKDQESEEEEEELLYDIWENDKPDEVSKNLPPAISAPKLKLPGHNESYNPPEEYLMTEKEKKEWLQTPPEERETQFLPKKYDNMRHIQFYQNLITERFERQLDLYLCPRLRKKKLDIDPESLVPTLPKPKELRPYPTTLNMQYKGHKSRVRAISVFHTGQYLASGEEKGDVYIWEVNTGRIVYKHNFEGIIYSVQFQPQYGMLAVACGENVYLLNIKRILNSKQYLENEENLQNAQREHQLELEPQLKWQFIDQGDIRVKLTFNDEIKSISFHEKGDYFCTVAPKANKRNEQIFIHSISKGNSTKPFAKSKGDVEKVAFHPNKPIIFIMTKKHVFVFNLQKQQTLKKLLTGAQWNSCLDIHPYGDNVIVGSFDKKVTWFDLDLGNTPYKNLKYHEKGIRQVAFSRKYPLMGSCSDDGTINVFHAKVFKDSFENALIIPLKVLKGHNIHNGLGVLDIVFHPTQPWMFSSGADHRIFLWT